MQKYKYIALLFVVLFLVGCAKDDFITIGDSRGEKAVYGFGVGGATTRTFINDDGVTISWSNDDKVALWAKVKGSDSYTLSNKTFDTWFVSADNSQAYFTAKLDSQMPDSGDENKNDDYTYYVCYPLPQSVSGTTATFNLPSTQDGKMGGGADIMVAQGTGPALAKLYTPANPDDSNVVPDYVIDDGVKLQMKHLIHALRFYVPQGKWGFPQGETVERIVFTMPANVAGTVTADVTAESPALSTPTNATNTISLNLKEPIGPSAADGNGIENYDYACASILPGTYNGDMTVKVYSQTKATQVTIPINGREMKAGHITPVGLNCTNVVDQYSLRFNYGGNNLGEDVTRISVKYTDENGAQQTLSIPVEQFAKDGGYYDVDLTDWAPANFSTLRTKLNGQEITVEYESENAIVSSKVNLPSDITQKGTSNITLTVPYLLEEDFGESFGVNSDHWQSKEKTASWIKDWSGNQWRTDGSNMGLCSYVGDYGYSSTVRRWVCTDAYFGRLDSPVLPLKQGKSVKLSISFTILFEENATNGSVSCIYGYSTSTDAIAGGYTSTIGYKSSVSAAEESIKRNLPSQKIKEIEKPDYIKDEITISNTPNNIRLTWFTNIHYVEKERITSRWFYSYIDDIKVQIVSE